MYFIVLSTYILGLNDKSRHSIAPWVISSHCIPTPALPCTLCFMYRPEKADFSPHSHSRGVIKSIVTRRCSHISLGTFLLPTGTAAPTITAHRTLLFARLGNAAHFNPLSQNVHLRLQSNLLHCHLECHSLPTTPPGSSLIQPLFLPPLSTFTGEIQLLARHHFNSRLPLPFSSSALWWQQQ